MAVDMSSIDFGDQHRPFGRSGPRRTVGGGETGFVAGFERKILFRIARFVALTICFVLFLGMVGGLVFIGTGMSGAEKPDPARVVQELRPANAPSGTSSAAPVQRSSSADAPTLGRQSPLIGLRVAPELQELMGQEQNKRVLEDWVSELDVADRQPFMDGLGQAVREARKHGVDDSDAVNAYYQQFQVYLVERESQKLASLEAKLYTAGAVVSVLLLLAMFSLVLVLLAIERNTYRTANLVHEQ